MGDQLEMYLLTLLNKIQPSSHRNVCMEKDWSQILGVYLYIVKILCCPPVLKAGLLGMLVCKISMHKDFISDH